MHLIMLISVRSTLEFPHHTARYSTTARHHSTTAPHTTAPQHRQYHSNTATTTTNHHQPPHTQHQQQASLKPIKPTATQQEAQFPVSDTTTGLGRLFNKSHIFTLLLTLLSWYLVVLLYCDNRRPICFYFSA